MRVTSEIGQLIARLDNAELTSVVMQHKATLQEAMARLAELKSGSRIQEIERARASVDAQAADADKAKDYERADILYKNGAISTSPVRSCPKRLQHKNSAVQKCTGDSKPCSGRSEKKIFRLRNIGFNKQRPW